MTARPDRWRFLALLVLLAMFACASADAQAQQRGGRWPQRMQRWQQLPPQQRARILQQQRHYRQLTPEQQRRLMQRYRDQRRP